MASSSTEPGPFSPQQVHDAYHKAFEPGFRESDLLGIELKTWTWYTHHKNAPLSLLYRLRSRKHRADDRRNKGCDLTEMYEDDKIWYAKWIMADPDSTPVVSFKEIESRRWIHRGILRQLNWTDWSSDGKTAKFGYGNHAKELIMTTGLPGRPDDYQMSQVFIVKAESDAIQAAFKVARQYWVGLGSDEEEEVRQQSGRVYTSNLKEKVNFILRQDLRHDSRHGHMTRARPTVGMERRREETSFFHKVSRCLYDEDKTSSSLLGVLERWSQRPGTSVPAPTENEKTNGLSVGRYVDALICELEDKFDELALRDEQGKPIDTVAAFVAEPWVGAALGCVGPAENYFPRVRDLCKRRGALLIFDEVMCGMARTGTLHAWQQAEIGFAPDIMTVGKAVGDRTMPAGALMIHKDVDDKLTYGPHSEQPTIPDCQPIRLVTPLEELEGTHRMETHGEIGGNEGIWCEASARAVLLAQRSLGLGYYNKPNNVKKLGGLLELEVKKRLAQHGMAPAGPDSPIRKIHGRGLFLGIRFGSTDLSGRAAEIASKRHGVRLYPGNRCLIVAPPLDASEKDIVDFAEGTAAALSEAHREVPGVADALPGCRGCGKTQGPAASQPLRPHL